MNTAHADAEETLRNRTCQKGAIVEWFTACSTGNWGYMSVMMLGLIAVLGLGAWALIRLTGGDQPPAVATESTREVLDRRLAAGDITTQEYAQARRLIEQRAGTATVT